jgi:Transposase IS116/IS110/IS902 family
VVSHISRKTSEMWGTRRLVAGIEPQAAPLNLPIPPPRFASVDWINRKAPMASALNFGWRPEPNAREQRSLMKIVGSGSKRRLGSISKQGNVFLRALLVEAAQSVVRHDPGFRKEYQHRCHHKVKGIPKVAAARKLAVRLYWMLKSNKSYTDLLSTGAACVIPWQRNLSRSVEWAPPHLA